MLIFPGIFIKNGRCRIQTKEESPRKLALQYAENGASYLHIIDTDGARLGHIANEESVEKILGAVNIPVQIGGGVRSLKDIEHLLEMGASRVIVGTKAVGNPTFIKDAITNFGSEKIVVSIDSKDGFIVTEGWEKVNSVRAIDHALDMKRYGVKYICYVDASQMGHTSFDFAEELNGLYRKTGLNIIAMGNMLSLKELELLKEQNAYAVVLGNREKSRDLDIKKAIELFN